MCFLHEQHQYTGGDLFDAITTATRFTEPHARLMIRHLASATAYLHSLGIVHRDIKPENLLVELNADGQVTELKLADFGLACEVTQPLLAVCGTPTYVAPEILLETGYGLKVSPTLNERNTLEYLFHYPLTDRRLGGRHYSVHSAVRLSAIRLARQSTGAPVRCHSGRYLRVSRSVLERYR